jgi:hypothetical protein
MDHERGARLTLGDHRRPHDLLLVLGPRPCATDLADEAGADPRVADSVLDVADDLPGNIVDRTTIHVGGMGGSHVVARAHDHV